MRRQSQIIIIPTWIYIYLIYFIGKLHATLPPFWFLPLWFIQSPPPPGTPQAPPEYSDSTQLPSTPPTPCPLLDRSHLVLSATHAPRPHPFPLLRFSLELEAQLIEPAPFFLADAGRKKTEKKTRKQNKTNKPKNRPKKKKKGKKKKKKKTTTCKQQGCVREGMLGRERAVLRVGLTQMSFHPTPSHHFPPLSLRVCKTKQQYQQQQKKQQNSKPTN